MRRKDREITDIDQIEMILAKNNVCRLALHGEEYPYLLPLNYGYVRQGDRFRLYFHGAREGMKMDALRRDSHAAFEVDCETRVIQGKAPGEYTMAYESVVAIGVLSIVEGDEKRDGLAAIMRQVAPGETFAFDQATLLGVTVLCLEVSQITGKRNRPA